MVASMLDVKLLSGEFHQNLINEKSTLVVAISVASLGHNELINNQIPWFPHRLFIRYKPKFKHFPI